MEEDKKAGVDRRAFLKTAMAGAGATAAAATGVGAAGAGCPSWPGWAQAPRSSPPPSSRAAVRAVRLTALPRCARSTLRRAL